MRLILLVALMCAGSNTGWTAEWVSIFNGKNLDGWTPKIKGQPAGKNLHNTFRVEDGLMKVGYKGYEQFDEQFGHIFYEKKYSHYRIRLEYRFVEEQLKGHMRVGGSAICARRCARIWAAGQELFRKVRTRGMYLQ